MPGFRHEKPNKISTQTISGALAHMVAHFSSIKAETTNDLSNVVAVWGPPHIHR